VIEETEVSWRRVAEQIQRLGGQLITLANDATLALYDRPSDPARAAALMPPAALVAARQPNSYRAFIERHGFQLVSLPNAMESFAFLPPIPAAQLTRATGETGRRWDVVVAERLAGRSTFPFVMFAAWNLADVHGWAFGPSPDAEPHVWTVEDGAPCVCVGTFTHWLTLKADGLRSLDRDEPIEGEDFGGPSSLDAL